MLVASAQTQHVDSPAADSLNLTPTGIDAVDSSGAEVAFDRARKIVKHSGLVALPEKANTVIRRFTGFLSMRRHQPKGDKGSQ